MDKYETPYPSKRDGQPGQPYEGGYEDVQKGNSFSGPSVWSD